MTPKVTPWPHCCPLFEGLDLTCLRGQGATSEAKDRWLACTLKERIGVAASPAVKWFDGVMASTWRVTSLCPR